MDPRPRNVNQPKASSNLMDWREYCQFLALKGRHRELLEGLITLVASIEKVAAGGALPSDVAQIFEHIENLFTVLSTRPPPPQPPPQPRPDVRSAPDLTLRLSDVEGNVTRAIAAVGYDILTAVGDLRTQVAVLARAPPFGFSRSVVETVRAKEHSMAELARLLRPVPRHCDCGAAVARRPQLDRRIHFASRELFYEVCPIEVTFHSFESENNLRVVVNFAAAASYTNLVKSVFAPKDAVRAQIPLMGMPSALVIGEFAARMQFSAAAAPVTLAMHVMACDVDRTVILGRDFADAYVLAVRHDNRTVTLKEPSTGRTVVKEFVYLRDVEMAFTRGRLKKEEKNVDDPQAGIDGQGDVNVDDLQARIDRLQAALRQQSTSDITDPMASAAERNANSKDGGVSIWSPKATKQDDRSDLQSSPQRMIWQKDLPPQVAEKAAKATVEKANDVDTRDSPKTSSQPANANPSSEIASEEKPNNMSHIVENVLNAGLADWEIMLKEVFSEVRSKSGVLKQIKESSTEKNSDLEKSAELEAADREVDLILRTASIGKTVSTSGARSMACRMQRAKPYEREPFDSETASKVENGEKNALDPTRPRPPVVTKKGSPELADSSSQCDQNEESDRKKEPDLPEVQIESSLQSGNGDSESRTATSPDLSEEPVPKETSPLCEPEKCTTNTPKCQQEDNAQQLGPTEN